VYGVEDVPPGFSRAGNGAILVRIAHTEAWLEHLHLSLGALAVTVKGTHILGTRLEVKDLPRFRFEHIIGEAEPDQFDPKIRIAHIECPIPEKVTEKLWVVLSNGSGWLDESHSNATIHPLGPTLNNITSELSRSPTSSGNDIFEALGGSMLSGIDSQNANKNVFIVHGHDDLKKLEVARFVDELGLNSIILHEKPNHGRTILQKFEDYSDVGFAIALLTADDVGAPKEEQTALRLRARQNVIFELGYFLAKLKSHRVCALYEEGVEIPSDYIGVIYIPLDKYGGWKDKLRKELVQQAH